MFCNQCGKEIEDGSKFCVYCGHSFVNGGSPSADGATPSMDGGFQPAFEGQTAETQRQAATADMYRSSSPMSNRDPVREKQYNTGILVCIIAIVASLAVIIVIFVSQNNQNTSSQGSAPAVTTQQTTTAAATQEAQTEAATTVAAD